MWLCMYCKWKTGKRKCVYPSTNICREENYKVTFRIAIFELTSIMGFVDAVWLTKQISGWDGSKIFLYQTSKKKYEDYFTASALSKIFPF